MLPTLQQTLSLFTVRALLFFVITIIFAFFFMLFDIATTIGKCILYYFNSYVCLQFQFIRVSSYRNEQKNNLVTAVYWEHAALAQCTEKFYH